MEKILQQKGFNIFHLNIRSLTPKLDQLRSIIENKNIDVFSISETWLHKGISSSILSISGYAIARFDRECTGQNHMVKRGGGLCVYYRSNLICDSTMYGNSNVSNKDLELQILQFERKNTRKTVIFNVYRPPNGNLDEAINCLNKAISDIPHIERKDIVILGDFNVDVLDKRHRDVKSLKYFASVNGLSQLTDAPTRCTPTSDKAIDLIFTNMDYIAMSGTFELFVSDHQPVFLVKKKTKIKHLTVKFSGRTYRNYNNNTMQVIDRIIDRNKLLTENDPSICWNYLLDDITRLANDITPRKDYKIRQERPSWLTNDLLNIQNDRDYFYKKAKRTKKPEDWAVARRHRNSVNTAIRTAKSTFIREELNRHKSNPKKFWRTIRNDILPDTKFQSINLIDPVTNLPYNNDEIPTIINEFFANIGPKLARDLP